MAFGTFDGLHIGHHYFLREAKKLGDYLIAVVAHDQAVKTLKKRIPNLTMEERAAALAAAKLVDQVVIGDRVQGSWEIFAKHKPDAVAIGHDQHELREDLQSHFPNIEVKVIGKQETFKPLAKKLSDFPIELVRKTSSDFNKNFHSKLFTLFAASESELHAFSERFSPHYGYCFGFQEGNEGNWFLDWDSVQQVRDWIVDKIKKEGSIPFLNIQIGWRKDWQSYDEIREKIDQTNFKMLSDEDLCDLFEQFHIGYLLAGSVAYMADTFMSTGEIDWLESVISQELVAKGVVSKDVPEIVRTLTNPLIDSYTLEAEWKLIEIATAIEKVYPTDLPSLETMQAEQPRLYKKLEAHTRSFFWIHNNYFVAEVLTIDFFYSELQKKSEELRASKSSFVEIMEKRNRGRKVAKKKRDDTFEKINLSNFTRELIKVAWLFAEWKDERKKGSYIGMHYYDLFLEELSRRVSYSKSDLTFLIFQEVKAVLLEGRDVAELIAQRKERTFYAVTPEGYFIAEGATAQGFFEAGAREHKKEVEWKGVPACRGFATGHVHIVRTAEDMKSFVKGEILVTNQTTPEFVPIMKKAVAIVTEQGGVTSHAAVISRELNVPCIIGVRDITRVLKTGDRIEVDAERGVVRKML